MAADTSSSSSSSTAGWKPTPAPHQDVAPGFHVPYEVKAGPYGNGVHVTVDVPKGTLLWKFKAGPPGSTGVNVILYRNEEELRARLAELTPEERAFMLDHVYMFNGAVNEILDDGKIWNHSETPNTGMPPPGDEYDWESSYAIRDIAAGEELLDDYGYYEFEDWYVNACKEHGVAWDFVHRKAPATREDVHK